jgi:DNA-directed RNA polymerase beta subunit
MKKAIPTTALLGPHGMPIRLQVPRFLETTTGLMGS